MLTILGSLKRQIHLATVTIIFGITGLGTAVATPIEYSIDPRAAYMTTDAADFSLPSLFLDLNSLGIQAGDMIRLEQLGDFRMGVNYTDVSKGLGGVFSSSNVLLPSSPSNPSRIPGAIDAGIDFVTGPTYFLGWATDIAEDFLITDITIEVPVAAQFLFIAAIDAAFNDNTDPDGDFGVRISKVPEPASLLLLGVGLFAMVRRRAH